ncbi:MAG: hypothetical protein JSV09_03790 [Thermoplasmata archaeon]|nr:MAG: hypothetical protein JSV09_03790 [Thermoplasmata archaeon]
MKSSAIKLFCLMLVGMLLLSNSSASGFDEWEEGDEVEITGHSFDEEYWTAEIINETENGTVTSSISYVNFADVQVYLIALKEITDNKGGKGILPYQLFGMNYFTPEGEEVFIGAIFAFLQAYNDTNGNNIQSPLQEPVYWILPFGLSDINSTWIPESTVIPVQKLGEGNYKFGMKYENLYAFATPSPLLVAAALASGNPVAGFLALLTTYVAKFSELTITYEININADDGTVTAETFYTIGQVTELYNLVAYILNNETLDPQEILTEDWGISAVHYVSVFTSRYEVRNASGKKLDTNIDQNMTEDITINIGNDYERAFEIGHRGTYDVIDEDTNDKLIENADAYNIMLQARLGDLALVLWQLGFSAGLFSVMSYALSDDFQEKYSSPKDLRQRWWMNMVHSAALWYAVSFPGWQGKRVVHDPVYTAYFGDAADIENGGPCGAGALVFIGALCIPGATIVSKRKRRKRLL